MARRATGRPPAPPAPGWRRALLALGLCLAASLPRAATARRTPPQLETNALLAVDSSRSADGLHVIGDVHGDENYMVRALLSTELFELSGKTISWRSSVPPGARVVVTGDIIDRGDNALECLQTLKRLTEHKRFGSQLTVTLGNHESCMLRVVTNYMEDARDDPYSATQRLADMQARSGPSHDLVRWMRRLPIMALSHGGLMMHGGLIRSIARKLRDDPKLRRACAKTGIQCGEAMVRYVNREARAFHRRLHECIKATTTQSEARDCDKRSGAPYFYARSDNDAPLWYRGYSRVADGAGSAETCHNLTRVAGYFGADFMAVGHTTHPWVQQFCSEVPLFCVDTHYTDCRKEQECDFDVKSEFHVGGIDFNKKKVPQSLRVQVDSAGRRTFQACLSAFNSEGALTVECYTPRH